MYKRNENHRSRKIGRLVLGGCVNSNFKLLMELNMKKNIEIQPKCVENYSINFEPILMFENRIQC